MVKDTRLSTKLWAAANWTLIGFFIVNLFGMIAAVVTSSFSTRWLRSWLPDGWTTRWYGAAWSEFQLGDVLTVTFQIVFLVVFLSGLIGVPAAYALARRDFPGKKLVMLLFLLLCWYRRSPSASRWRRCSTAPGSPARCRAWCSPISCRPCPLSSW